MRVFSEETARAVFVVAGLKVHGVWELPNQYWPEAIPDDWENPGEVADFLRYAKRRAESPWFLVKTDLGLIKIGWRKRVINIDWSDTAVRAIVTDDNVTKDETFVHACSASKAAEYMNSLGVIWLTAQANMKQPCHVESNKCGDCDERIQKSGEREDGSPVLQSQPVCHTGDEVAFY